MMLGWNLKKMYPKCVVAIGEPLKSIEGLSRTGEYYNVEFDLRRAEMVYISNCVEVRRTEVVPTQYAVQQKNGFMGKLWPSKLFWSFLQVLKYITPINKETEV